ncbi:Mitochondrial inner membrane protease atp23 [Elasticomyces elasticus]|nr:Mitochondrial inner membrane protease atp23 [Elasticomyces elasticus]
MGDNTSSLPETTTSPSSTEPAVPDKDFYNWSNFFSILTGSASPSAREAYFNARDTKFEERDCKTCEKSRDWLLENSPIIRFMKHNINLLGQDINSENVHCKRCTTKQSGGFDAEYGIMICANQLRNQGHLEDTMAHEMVHAYDHLRFKLDPLDLRHAAYTSLNIIRRVQIRTGILHARSMEHYAAAAGVC